MNTLSFLQATRRFAGAGVAGICMLTLTTAAFGQDLNSFQPYQLYEAARDDHDYVAAAGYARESLAAAEKQHGNSSLELVDPLERLADVLVLSGELQSAILQYARVLRIQEDSLGVNHPELIPTLDAIASIAIALEKYDDAEAYLQRILNIERSVYGDKHDQVIITMNRLRDVYVRQDRAADVARIDSDIEAAKFEERARVLATKMRVAVATVLKTATQLSGFLRNQSVSNGSREAGNILWR